jgi:acyl-CoA synthetase (AMP-forming)/AMP-acid ligase II
MRDALDAEGWFHTGDLARIDEEGFYFIVDRVKDMFISGGENVYPVEIEKALYEHPAMAQCAVIGVPDEKWGEVGKAVVVLKPNMAADDVYPPQPMVSQTRTVLDKYRANGGAYWEKVIAGTGHTPYIEKPDEFVALLLQHLHSARA